MFTMDGIQKLLVVVIISLTALLAIVGVQVILIILDLRKSVKRLNSILEDSVLGGGLIRPEKLTGIVEMFRRKKKIKKRGIEEI
ncbi:hypothetical protein KKB40_02685 [Patescibacteria group bacterium]|nr:hypothetical protein [Patescibacteria group bacterium]